VSWLYGALGIFAGFLVLMLVVAAVMDRGNRELARVLLLADLQEAVVTRPFPPVPALLESEQAAARARLERDVRWMIAEGERRVPVRWR
jgi:hypothetical protein